jgi:hypothetical protein
MSLVSELLYESLMQRRIFPFLAGLLLLANPVWATMYYVATNGSDNNPGTLSAPWRSLAKAAATLNAGDIAYFRAGVYAGTVTLNRSGNAGAPITYQSYPGETAIIDGNMNGITVYINGAYNTFRDLEVRNCGNDCFQIYGRNFILDNLHIHHGRLNGVRIDSWAGTGNINGTIMNSRIYDMDDGMRGGNSDADCASASGPDPTAPGNIDNGYHTIINNVFHDCTDDGFDSWASHDNYIARNISYHNGYIPFTETQAGNGNGFKLGGASRAGANNLVIDNVAYRNYTRNFDGNGGAGNRLYNNMAHTTNCYNYANFSAPTVAINNIAVESTAGCTLSTNGMTTNHHNSWNLGMTNLQFMSIDPANVNFMRLSAGSPAINAGATVGENTHPCAGVCDLGAFEYGSGSPTDLTAPLAPKDLRLQ